MSCVIAGRICVTIEQNYPNPFNPSTQIRFSLSKPSHVKLAVYDMLGREVARLADEEMDAGYHSVTWNARNVSSGVYIYKLSAGSFVQVKRMILMK
ncbi:MAG: T9SS type A sorting domain-containing protein [Bacteroidetes bacterium]|nr:T9SS type A sorting domain-containing protein [Bacteroidota bacterium]